MEETMISKITDVKYTGSISPTASPFWAMINATSPRAIIPTPIFRESGILNLHIRLIRPQPMIFATRATTMNPMENQMIPALISPISVFNPILAKNTGPNNIYELISIFSAI